MSKAFCAFNPWCKTALKINKTALIVKLSQGQASHMGLWQALETLPHSSTSTDRQSLGSYEARAGKDLNLI